MCKLCALSISLLLGVTSSLYADQTATDYAADKGVIDNNRGKVVNLDTSQLPQYDHNPGQQSYYHGVATMDSDLQEKGRQSVDKDKAGGTVVKAFLRRDQIKINTDSPDFDDSTLAKQDAYNITHGISDQYIDCNKHQSCKTVMEQHECIRTNTVNIDCTRIPKVTVDVEPFVKPVPKPCVHILISSGGQPPHSKVIASFGRTSWFTPTANYHVYAIDGPSSDGLCYTPNSYGFEHTDRGSDSERPAVSTINVFKGAIYFFHAQAFFPVNAGNAYLQVKQNGKVLTTVKANANAAANTGDAIVANEDGQFVLNGYAQNGYGHHVDFVSAYWASTPLKQTHKVPHVRWEEDCGGNNNA